MARRTLWSAAAVEILADGGWHDRDDLIGQIAPMIPPGRAYRAAETHRRRWRTGDRQVRVRGDHDTAIGAGRRRIASDALWCLVRDGHAQRDGRRYRRRRR